jgi:tetratricopeptide (TPR) repeat protein
MSNKQKEELDNPIDQVGNVLTRTELYIEKNRKILMIIVALIVVGVGAWLGYKKLIVEPNEVSAHQEMFMAEQYFAKDSFKLALNGDAQYPGFITIIDQYGSTKAGNLSNYYAGICYLNMGQFDKAVEYLNEFSTDDNMLYPISQGALGDANLELGKTEDALAFYKKAADDKPNDFTSPIYLMKAGFALEKLNRWDEALTTYERIEKEFNRTNEGRKIEKYITRAKIKLNKN